MNGPGPIMPENILAYQSLYGMKLTAWELEVIDAFDAIALEAYSKKTT